MPDEFDPSIPIARRLKYMHASARRRLLASAAKAPMSDYTFTRPTPIGDLPESLREGHKVIDDDADLEGYDDAGDPI